jgi:hypothetical protein
VDALFVLHGRGEDIEARAPIKSKTSVAIYIVAIHQGNLVGKDFGRINVLGVTAGKAKKITLVVPFVAHSTEER